MALCSHARLIRLVLARIQQVLGDEFHPNMRGYELRGVPKLLNRLELALKETAAALPQAAIGVLQANELARLAPDEIVTTRRLLERAGCRTDEKRRGCVCEEREADLAKLTKRIASSLGEEGITLYGLQGLAGAVLELHKGLGLVPSTTDDGTDWSAFSLPELFYLDAVMRKASGKPLRPPTPPMVCSVCGGGGIKYCPVGCTPDDATADGDPIYEE
jgi:hypothetical protein